MSFPSQHGLQSRASNSKAINGTHSMEDSSAGIVQCCHPPCNGGHRRGPKSHTLGIERQPVTIKAALQPRMRVRPDVEYNTAWQLCQIFKMV